MPSITASQRPAYRLWGMISEMISPGSKFYRRQIATAGGSYQTQQFRTYFSHILRLAQMQARGLRYVSHSLGIALKNLDWTIWHTVRAEGPKLCERCQSCEVVKKERYCKTCKAAVLKEIRASGYLETGGYGAYPGEQRTAEQREDRKATRWGDREYGSLQSSLQRSLQSSLRSTLRYRP